MKLKNYCLGLNKPRTLYLDRVENAIKYNESKYKETQDDRYKGYLKILYQLKEKIKMSREIKFRAWHKTKEKYYPIVSLNFYTQEVCIGKPYVNVWVSFDDVVLEQYTGLNDKNGVEIYEGDIVEFEDIVGEVHFLPQQNGYAVITYNSDYKLVGWKYGVIGNIHENKELLK